MKIEKKTENITKPIKKSQNNNKLINCKACDQQISKNADACPHCGEPSLSNKLNKTKKNSSSCGGCLGVFLLFIIIGSFGSVLFPNKDIPKTVTNNTLELQEPAWIEVDLPISQQFQVCRATIATLMHQNIEIINIDRSENNIYYMSYERPDDGTIWKNRCKLSGSNVVWAAEPDGRWRTHPEDSKITYNIYPDISMVTISEQWSDGSKNTKQYNLQM